MADDLLAGDNADNQAAPPPADTPAEPPIDQGPPPSAVQYPEWVPGQFHAPEKRGELLQALGIDVGKQLPSERPDFIPEKFWDAEQGLQLDKLGKSYVELEKKLGAKAPPVPESYEIKLPEGVELPEGTDALTEDDVALFKELGLGNEQAQKVIDHLWAQVIPVLAEQQGVVERTKLAGMWEMKPDAPEFEQRRAAVREWAESNLPHEVVDNLRRSSSGVHALWVMMQNKVAPGGAPAPSTKTDAEIQAMMDDPRYWQEGQDAYRAEVEAAVRARAKRG